MNNNLEPTRRELMHLATVGMAAASLPAYPAVAQTKDTQMPQTVPPVRVAMTINGARTSLDVDPRLSLLDLLRERLDLTGTKKGCNQGACGACTIMLDGRRVNACLTLAVMHEGASITTIEGLANGGDLHPLQTAFIEHEGFQCGYCTAGQIMSGVGCIAEGHAGNEDEIRFWMSGNICRCGAYPGIVAAVAQTAQGT